MTVYSIMYQGQCEDSYSKHDFLRKIREPFCQNAIKEQGHVHILKENEKSRRFGDIVPHPDGGLEILWYELERMHDGAYGN